MCKLEEYGNCDEETKEQEYCIFHKPDKNEIEAKEFYKKFLERFRHRKEKIKEKIKFKFKSNLLEKFFGENVEIEVERFVFEEDVNCSGFVFPKTPKDFDFSFDSSIFKGLALFGMQRSNTMQSLTKLFLRKTQFLIELHLKDMQSLEELHSNGTHHLVELHLNGMRILLMLHLKGM